MRSPPRAVLPAAAAVLSWLALVLAPSGVVAQEIEEPPGPAPAFHVDWELGPLGACARAEELAAEVSALLGRDAFVDDSARADRTIRVQARQDSIAAWIVEVAASRQGASDGVRRLFLGPVPCAEARQAVVEVLALALDYHPPPAEPAEAAVQAPLQPEPERPAPTPPWVGHVGVDFAIGRGLLPGTHAGLALVGALAPPGSLWSMRARGVVWGPARANETALPGTTYEGWSWHVSLAACRRFFDGAPVELRLCGGGLAGQLVSSASVARPSSASTQRASRALYGLDLGVGLTTSSSAPVQLVVDLGAIIPFDRPPATFCASLVDVDGECDEGSGQIALFAPEPVVPQVAVGLRWRLD